MNIELDCCVNIGQNPKKKKESIEKVFARKGLDLKTLLSDCRKQGMTLEEMAFKLEIERYLISLYLKKYGLSKSKPSKEARLQKTELEIWKNLSLADAIKSVRETNRFSCMALPTIVYYLI